MTHLFSKTLWQKGENVTTETFAYLLEEFDTCRSAFLSLVNDSTNPENFDKDGVSTQWVLGHRGRPDLVLEAKDKKQVAFIENKPWDGSSFTGKDENEDQLKRYAEGIKESKAQEKIQCLLAKESNREYLLQEIVKVEGGEIQPTEEAIKKHYDKDKIKFFIITWAQVLDRIEDAHEENPVAQFLIDGLRETFPRPLRPGDIPSHEEDSGFKSILEVPFIRTQTNTLYKEVKYSVAEFQGGPLQAANIKDLYKAVIKKLWKDNPAEVLDANEKVNDEWRPIKTGSVKSWQSLEAEYALSDLWYNWCLVSLRDLLKAMNLEKKLFVKYAEDEK